MDRAFESGAIGVAPTVPAVPSVGFPTGGNPVGGVPATKPGAHWFHMVTEELRALIVAGGLTPSPSVVDQVLQALPAALASRPEMARSLAAAGYQRLPGGLIFQWGSATVTAGTATVINFAIAFPTVCVSAGVLGAAQSTGATTATNYYGLNQAPTTTQLSLISSGSGGLCRWLAIGY